jgi:radical SAM superfamily enzyme YgiQ (UPF0313 family)
LSYLSAFLIRAGFSVQLIDNTFLGGDDAMLLAEIRKAQPALAGFSLFLTNAAAVLRLIAALGSTGWGGHVTLGGHHATFNYRAILRDNPGVASIVLGEGEEALAELVGRLRTGRPWQDVANLAYHDPWRGVVANACRPLVSDLDALPHPYRQPYAHAIRASGVAAMVSSRGCYGRCSFCSIRAFYRLSPGKPWRMRSPKSVVDEMAALVAEHGVKSIIFLDHNFLGPGRLGQMRAQAIAAELVARRIAVSRSIACRPNDRRDIGRGHCVARGGVCRSHFAGRAPCRLQCRGDPRRLAGGGQHRPRRRRGTSGGPYARRAGWARLARDPQSGL